MTYLVTGCAGFIGWKVCERLASEGHTVVGVDNLNTAYDVRLKQWRLARLQSARGFSFRQLDIGDREALPGAMSRDSVDAVINLAARAGVRQSVEDPWVYVATNITGTLNLLELCRTRGVKKFVLASTSSVYGSDTPRPYREDAATDHPLSPYAASKKGAEVLAYTYHALYGIDVTVVRYFTVYGPAGRPDMSLFRFVKWVAEGDPVIVYGDGTQERDFTYVDDIAAGTVAALKPLGFEVINLGSDHPIVLNDALRLVEELVGAKARVVHRPRHEADVQATRADITRARTLLGWSPRYEFRDGVTQLVSWYLENRTWAREISTG